MTQVPIPQDFTTVGSVFANHLATMQTAGRGGDLYIRYGDGTLKNLTQAAGYGSSGMQGSNAIAVREPCVHWDGTKALFSMVVGAPTQRYQVATFYWQIYEITGLGINDTPVITKVAQQPAQYNNVSPIYTSDDKIIFSSDKPRGNLSHTYPQRDEYESTATVSGLWLLNPATSDLRMLDHAPSGDFKPSIDSFGRVIFTRWDHLQRDQQADGNNKEYGAFNFSSESASAEKIDSAVEIFPEPRSSAEALPNLELHSINQFFPWMMTQQGYGLETLNHIGRHELFNYMNRSFKNDPNVTYFAPSGSRFNQNQITNMLQIREDPLVPGRFYAVDAPEFYTHAAGQIFSINGAPSDNADQMAVTYVTHRETATADDTPSANHSGLYRSPLPLSNGVLVATHTAETRVDANTGTAANPGSRYAFRLKTLKKVGNYFVPDQALTPGITKSITFWNPDTLVSYNTELWELDPVEVRATARPPIVPETLASPEATIFAEEQIDVAQFREYLSTNGLALIVSRNVTTRDRNDRQQPFNLQIAGSSTQTVGASGKVYEISSLQLLQGDLLRGYGGIASSQPGRRVIAQEMHDAMAYNPPDPGGPTGSTKLGSDGSLAAFVPAERALTWQLTDPQGMAVVRERYWVTFGRGEIRVCASCHGINSQSQSGGAVPQNPPEALRTLLRHWKTLPQENFSFTLNFVQSGGRRIKKANTLQAGRSLVATIQGSGIAAAGKNLRLSLSINNKQCDQPIESFTTDSEGNYTLRGKVPMTYAAPKLDFALEYAGITKTAKSVRVSARGKRTRITNKERKRLCRQLIKLQ